MTTMQIDAEIFCQLSLIAEDDGKMKRALKALRRIAEPKTDPTLATAATGGAVASRGRIGWCIPSLTTL